jgi:hypothetical protein
MAFNGSAALSGTHLRVTNGGQVEAGSGWFTTLHFVRESLAEWSRRAKRRLSEVRYSVAFVNSNNVIQEITFRSRRFSRTTGRAAPPV